MHQISIGCLTSHIHLIKINPFGAEFPNRIINGVLKIYIKFMVSLRCKLIVQQQLDRIGIPYLSIELGMVETEGSITSYQIDELRKSLQIVGLEILENKKSILIGKIKNVIEEMIQYKEEVLKVNYSDSISKKVGYDYTYLSNIFSEVEGITIQQFIIIHKIEKVKELLLYDELSLTEISYRMNYSSVCHLSSQFKKITGQTPSLFHQSHK
jgi:AraC-like DNA-binding protein